MVRHENVFVQDLLLRLGLFIAAAYGFYLGVVQWGTAADGLHPHIVLLGLATYLATFAMLFCAVTGVGIKFGYRAILIFYVFSLLVQAYLRFEGEPLTYGTDSAAFQQAAAEDFLHGENPYTQDLLASLDRFRMPPTLRTPHVDGSYQSQIPYPSLSFLLYIPFVAVGIADARIILLVYHLLVLILIYVAAPRLIKPFVLVPLFVTPEALAYTFGTVTDMPWVFYLTAAAVLWKRKNASALLFGIALSIKQHPWVLLPFIAIRIWKESEGLTWSARLNLVIRYFGIAEIVFLAVNAPFIIESPNAWVSGVLSPPLGNLVVYGQGLSTLSQVGFMYAPRAFYTISALLVVAALMIIYWIHFRQLSSALWLFPAIILWFPYRSLQSYFVYWIPPLIVSLYPMITNWVRTGWRIERRSTVISRLEKTMSLGAASAAASFVLGGLVLFTLAGKPTFQVSIQRALLDPQTTRVRQLDVTVRNDTTDILNPVFWVKQTGQPAFHWEIIRGPSALTGGAESQYSIQAEFADYEVPNSQSLAVAVNDAYDSDTTSYSPTFGVDLTTRASLINADFFYWTLENGSHVEQPYGWGFYQLGSASNRSGHIAENQVEGKQCVSLWTTVNPPSESTSWLGSYLDQWVEFPHDKMRVPVFPTFTSGTETTPSRVFGVEVRENAHQLWYIFTDADERIWQDPHDPTIGYHVMNAPISRWSYQTLDIASDYSALHWDMPAEQFVMQDGQTSSKRMINFRVFVGTRAGELGTLSGCFGPIIQHVQ